MRNECFSKNKLIKSFSRRKIMDRLSFSLKKGQVFDLLEHNTTENRRCYL